MQKTHTQGHCVNFTLCVCEMDTDARRYFTSCQHENNDGKDNINMFTCILKTAARLSASPGLTVCQCIVGRAV